jgi:hypothetical protein
MSGFSKLVTKKLDQRETDRLYGISVIPTVVVFAITVFYYSFVHLEQTQPLESLMMDSLVNLCPSLMVGGPLIFFLTFEILHAQRVREQLGFHLKRWMGRMATVCVMVSLFYVIFLASYFLLVPAISEEFVMRLGFGLWLVSLGLLLHRFGDFFAKLDRGGI